MGRRDGGGGQQVGVVGREAEVRGAGVAGGQSCTNARWETAMVVVVSSMCELASSMCDMRSSFGQRSRHAGARRLPMSVAGRPRCLQPKFSSKIYGRRLGGNACSSQRPHGIHIPPHGIHIPPSNPRCESSTHFTPALLSYTRARGQHHLLSPDADPDVPPGRPPPINNHQPTSRSDHCPSPNTPHPITYLLRLLIVIAKLIATTTLATH